MESCAALLEIGELGRLVDDMPIGLVVEDETGHIVWANRTFVEFFSETCPPFKGRRVHELPLTRVPGVGANPDYCQIKYPRKGGPEWLLCSGQRLSPANGRQLVARFYLDASEHRRVQRLSGLLWPWQQGEGGVDQVTGALDRSAITQTLQSEVSRSRRYHNPLAVVRLRVAVSGTDPQGHDVEHIMAVTARLLREQMRWVDRIGRWSEREFLLVLPESNALAASSLVGKIQRCMVSQGGAGPDSDRLSVTVQHGLAEWQRGDDLLRLLERAEAGLETA